MPARDMASRSAGQAVRRHDGGTSRSLPITKQASGAGAMKPTACGAPNTGYWLWNRDEQAHARAKRLFVPLTEGIAVARLQKPPELSLRRRPKHEIERERAGNFHGPRRVCQFRPDTNHELDGLGQGERLFEQKIDAPFGPAIAKQGRKARFEFQPFFERLYFHGYRRAETKAAISQAPVACASDF